MTPSDTEHPRREPRTAAVLHAHTAIGAALARGLADGGLAVGIAGGAGALDDVAAAIRADGGTVHAHGSPLATRADHEGALAAIVAALGPVDLVVAPITPRPAADARRADGDATAARPLAEQSVDDWIATCEAPLRTARFTVQAAHGVLARPGGAGGCIVLVAAASAVSGEPGQAGLVAAAEGARAMTRVVAKAWGPVGITLHWVGVPTDLLTGHAGTARLAAWDAALGRAPDARRDVAPVVAALARPGHAFVTASTTIVDGGNLPPL